MEQKYITDKSGNKVLPITHMDAVRDSQGNTLASLFGAYKDGVNARLDDQDDKLDLLNGSEVIVVADHTAVVSPDTQKIYREQGTTSYTDWMYNGGSWKEIATYGFPGIDSEPTPDSNNLAKSGGIAAMYGEYVENIEYVKVETDVEGKIVNAITKEGEGIVGGINVNQLRKDVDSINIDEINRDIQELKEATDCFKQIDDIEKRLEIVTDSEDRILSYRKEDGTKVEYSLQVNGKLSLSEEAVSNLNHTLENDPLTDIVSLNGIQYTTKSLSNIKRASRVDATPVYTPFTILHASDIHGNVANFDRMVEFYHAYKGYIDDAIISGDLVSAQYSDSFACYAYGEDKSILLCVGNHDTAKISGSFDWTYHVGEDCYNKFFKNYIPNWGNVMFEENKCYYYKDYAEYSIRIIVLDMMELTKNGQESLQLQWFRNCLEDARQLDYTVIGVIHSFRSIDLFDCPFSSKIPQHFWGVSGISDIVEDFIVNDGGKFACWLSGHTHNDYVGVVTGTHQLIVQVDTSSITETHTDWSDTERIRGNKSQDLFNIVGIDTNLKMVKVLRIGADMDSLLRSKKSMCLQYASNEFHTLDGGMPVLVSFD